MQRAQYDESHLYEEYAIRPNRNEGYAAPTSGPAHSNPSGNAGSVKSHGQERIHGKPLIKFAVILGLIILTTLLATTIALHFQQKLEWKQALASIANRSPNEKAPELERVALEVALVKNISQVLKDESRESHQNISKSMKTLIKKVENINRAMGIYPSCKQVDLLRAKSRNETGGAFDIEIPGVGIKEVYCNTEIDGEGWIVFQRRMDGSVDFYRNWTDFVTGFGSARGEYWLGLEAIHQLTKNGKYELRIDMIERDETRYYAIYSDFQVGPARDNFRLTAGRHSGNASDRLNYHNNLPFSTEDADHDSYSGNCAASYSSGWWFGGCHNGNLNGVYTNTNGWYGVVWYDHRRSKVIHMRFTEMKFREIF